VLWIFKHLSWVNIDCYTRRYYSWTIQSLTPHAADRPRQISDKAWEAIVKSQDVARKYRNQQLEVEHLAIALLEEDETTTLLLERVMSWYYSGQLESVAFA
jgi:Clp amino terminal domain, pathogenicity island component